MISSYYLWKWADNDLPGKPNDVFATLMRGDMPAALETFDSVPVVRQLEKAAEMGRQSDEEWDWQVCPSETGKEARFIHVRCVPKDNPTYSREPFLDWWDELGISGYDEQRGQLIECLSPKLNVFESEQWWDEPRYDVDAAELAVLLRRLRPNGQNPFAELRNRRGNFVQCFGYGRRYSVEWHERLDPTDWNQTDAWRLERFPSAGKRRQFIPSGVEYSVVKDSDWCRCFTGESTHETITFSETLKIFRAFLRGEPRPTEYHWRCIQEEL
jgi:hypothetical protein